MANCTKERTSMEKSRASNLQYKEVDTAFPLLLFPFFDGKLEIALALKNSLSLPYK